jgi:hypothetical protein
MMSQAQKYLWIFAACANFSDYDHSTITALSTVVPDSLRSHEVSVIPDIINMQACTAPPATTGRAGLSFSSR